MANLLFIISILLLLYSFLGFPALIWIAAGIRGWRSRPDPDCCPGISILLAVYNEQAVINQKIENFLQLAYPKQRLEMIIVSDGSDDKTVKIVRSCTSERIRLFVQSKRIGKTLALNLAAREAKGDILVFTDANSIYHAEAIHRLAQHFNQPEVGLVSGRSVYLDQQNRYEASGGLYRSYEEFIKRQESATVSIVGADGAIYAMRKELYEPLPAEHINDLIHPMQVVVRGYRTVQEPRAVCQEISSADPAQELRRQTRIMAQSWRIVLSQLPAVINAGRWGYLWALISHKILRWMTLPLMAILLASNLFLLAKGQFFVAFFWGQAAFYIAAVLGCIRVSRLLRIPAMFILLHLAAVFGLYRLLTGHEYTTWNPRQS